VFCYVPFKFKQMYDQYWNLTLLFGRLYCVQKKDIEAIEKVQRRFTKRLTGLSAYSERL